MSDEILAGNFEDHYSERYKKHSPSVEAFTEDAENAFATGETVPAMVPRETIGLPADKQEVMSRFGLAFRSAQAKIAEQKKLETDQLKQLPASAMRNTKGDKTSNVSPMNTEQLKQQQKEKRIAPEKEMLKQALAEQEAARVKIDPSEGDSIIDPSMYEGFPDETIAAMQVNNKISNAVRKTGYELAEGLWEGFENVSRTALIAGTTALENLMPDIGSDYYQAWVSLLNDPNVQTSQLMRPNMFPDIVDQEGLGYGFARGFAQFMPSFLFASARLSGINSIPLRGMVAGVPADYLAFDTADGNLHSAMRMLGEVEIPGLGKVNLDNEYTRFLSADLADSQAEGRLLNAIEGSIIGVIGEYGVTWAMKLYGKATKQELATRVAKTMVQTAKGIRAFRTSMATSLERQALINYDKALAAAEKEMKAAEKPKAGRPVSGSPQSQKGGIGTDDKPSAPGALLPESRQRMVAALSELALARIVKGDIKLGKPQDWVQMMGSNLASPMKGEGKAMMKEAFDNAAQVIKSGGQRPFWYSKVERSVLSNMDTKVEMNGQQILDALVGGLDETGKQIKPTWQYRSRTKQGNVPALDVPINPMEVKFSGLEAWLKINKDRVIQKDEIVDFIRAHRVKVTVQEHKKGRDSDGSRDSIYARFMSMEQSEFDEQIAQRHLTYNEPEQFNAERAYDQADQAFYESDYPDDLWQQAQSMDIINDWMSEWGKEIAAKGFSVVRDADGALNQSSQQELAIHLAGRLMQKINFDGTDIKSEIDDLYDGVAGEIIAQSDAALTADDIGNVAADVISWLEKADGDVNWMNGSDHPLTSLVNEPYGLRDAAEEPIRDEFIDEYVRDAEASFGRAADNVYVLDANDSYYINIDSDGYYQLYANGRAGNYYPDAISAQRHLIAEAVDDGVIEDPTAPKEISADAIVKKGFKDSDYSQYTFTKGNLDDYAYDDKYLVYTLQWSPDQVRADKDLLTAKLLEQEPVDPELVKLLRERELIIGKKTPDKQSSGDTHLGESEYAHVRMTFRKPIGSDEVIPHIEEFQSDYLQGFSKAGSKSMTTDEAALVLENYNKLKKVYDARISDFRVKAYETLYSSVKDAVSGDAEKIAGSIFNLENLTALRDELNAKAMPTIDGLGYAIEVWNPRHEGEIRLRYLREFAENLPSSVNEVTGPFMARAGVKETETMGAIGQDLVAATALKKRADKAVNPTPFDEKDFHRQVAGPILKAMLDKGYKKISFSRPWSEGGSRNTSAIAWRELEVPPYVDENGVQQTTAFLIKKSDGRHDTPLSRETDLNKLAVSLTDELYGSHINDSIEGIKNGETNTLRGVTIARTLKDVIGESGIAALASETAKPDIKALARAWKKATDGRKGYDSAVDHDPLIPKQWNENANIEMLDFAGYETNYSSKLPKMMLSVVQEFDPAAKLNKGKSSLLYKRPSAEYGRFRNTRMPSLGDATGLAENPYFGMDPNDVLKQLNVSDELMHLSDLDTDAVFTLTQLKYLPEFNGRLPSDASILHYIPNPEVRRLFNNRTAAEKVLREYNAYDVEWIDLSGMYDTIDGKEVRKTDGGVSVLGLVPGAAIPAYLLGGGSSDAQAAEQQPAR